jgi:ABC-type transport system involved in multi-copper enzyme maturation permease subunit
MSIQVVRGPHRNAGPVSALAAEILKARQRPATWIVAAVWALEVVLFAYTIPYVVYKTLPRTPGRGENPEALLHSVLPGHLVATGTGIFPLYGAVIMVVLGALTAGNEYRWGTLGTIFTQGPSRSSVMAAKLVALLTVLAGVVVLTFCIASAYGAVIAVGTGRAATWPGPLTVLEGLGAAWLISSAMACGGFMLAVVFRSTTVAIAAGLVWVLAAENAISGLAAVVPAIRGVRWILLEANASALAHSFGASTTTEGAAPSLAPAAGPLAGAAALLLCCALFIAVSVAVTRSRDVG